MKVGEKMSVIYVPEGVYSSSTVMYNSLVSQGYFGWSTSPYSRRVMCFNGYTEFVWVETTTTNINDFNSIFDISLTSSVPFMGILFSNKPGEYQLANNQSGTIYPTIVGDTVKERTIHGHRYYCGHVSTNNTGVFSEFTGIYNVSPFSTIDLALNAISIKPIGGYSITYYPTNVTLDPAPPEAIVGDTVTVGVSVPAGYTIRDPSSNIVVRNNGIIVPHTWDASSSRFTFTMPDPS